MEDQVEITEGNSLAEEARSLHPLLLTEKHHKAIGSTPPEIFEKTNSPDVCKIDLLDEKEIREAIDNYTRPKSLSQFGIRGSINPSALKMLIAWKEELKKFGGVLDHLRRGNHFSPEEIETWEKGWKETLAGQSEDTRLRRISPSGEALKSPK